MTILALNQGHLLGQQVCGLVLLLSRSGLNYTGNMNMPI